MLVWNGFAAAGLLLLALVGLDPTLFEKRCPRCSQTMQAGGRLELLARRANRYIGWRTFRCLHCSYEQAGLAISRDPRGVVNQTHRVS